MNELTGKCTNITSSPLWSDYCWILWSWFRSSLKRILTASLIDPYTRKQWSLSGLGLSGVWKGRYACLLIIHWYTKCAPGQWPLLEHSAVREKGQYCLLGHRGRRLLEHFCVTTVALWSEERGRMWGTARLGLAWIFAKKQLLEFYFWPFFSDSSSTDSENTVKLDICHRWTVKGRVELSVEESKPLPSQMPAGQQQHRGNWKMKQRSRAGSTLSQAACGQRRLWYLLASQRQLCSFLSGLDGAFPCNPQESVYLGCSFPLGSLLGR